MHKINSARHQKRTDQHSSAHRSQFFVFFKKLIEIVLFKVVENALVVNFSHSLLLARPARWRHSGCTLFGSNHSGQVACRTRLGLLGTGNDWKRRRSMSITKTIRWFLGQRTTMTYDDSPMTLRAHHSGLASVAQGACACAPTKGELRTVCPSNQYP